MKAKLTKQQVFNNAERDYNNYKKTHQEILDSHKKYRAEYGSSEVEMNFKKQEDFAKKRLADLKKKMDKAKLALI
ncbi:MAG: hypothetical protein ACRCZ9_09320 [Fusobacteriaceae bacterium]